MKVILVWDPRFPALKPARLMLDDQLASACVRAGVAAAADPAEQAGLAAGPALDPGSLGDAIVQHGTAKRPVRIVLPASVIAVGVALGIAAPAAGPPIPGDTAPIFTAAPSIAPSSGTSSTTFTATDGTVSNGTVTGRRWLLNGTAIGTGTTIVPGATGSLVLENTATGPGGTTTATSTAVTVSAVPAPSFTAAPSISPSSGDSATTFTATDGTVSNGSVTARRWLLSGTAIGTGTTIVPGAAGSLVLENTATGPGGSTTATSSAIAVTAAPAPLITSINADGWSGEYRVPGDLPAMNTSLPSEMAPEGASPKSFLVDRAGFTATGAATTYTETRIVTKRRRQAYPNYTLAEPASLALDDYVYATDSIAGVTNNSTETSPKPIAEWAMPARLLVGNSVHWEMVAFHRDFRSNRQVACVRVRANDGTTQTAWQTVAATAISTTVEDANPVEVYQGDLDVTALATGAIWLEAEVYPWIGTAASVLKSEEVQVSAGYTPRKFGRRYFHKDASRATAPPLAYVDPAGNDSTGVWSTNAATAQATPFLTLTGAHAAIMHATRGVPATGGLATGCRIYINGAVNTGTVAQVSNPQGGAGVIVTRAPGVARASAVLTIENGYRPSQTCSISGLESAVIFTDLTLKRTNNAATIRGETATGLWWHLWNITLIDASGTFGSPYSSSHGSLFGVLVDPTTTNLAWLTEQNNEVRIMRGVTADMNSTSPMQWVTFGCKLSRVQNPNLKNPADGCIVYGNKFLAHSGAGAAIGVSATNPGDTITGVAILQNLVEVTGTGSNPIVRISSDGANGSTVHTVVAHNTVAGFVNSRLNAFYDESSGTNRRTHRLIRMVGNIWVQTNTKGDRFYSTTDATEAANRTGNFGYLNGVGCEGEWTMFCSADGAQAGSAFSQMHPGLRCSIGTSLTVRNDPLFVSYQATVNASTAGAGGGDYRLQAGSPARGRVSRRGLAFDLAGAARPTSGLDACGAYA